MKRLKKNTKTVKIHLVHVTQNNRKPSSLMIVFTLVKQVDFIYLKKKNSKSNVKCIYILTYDIA